MLRFSLAAACLAGLVMASSASAQGGVGDALGVNANNLFIVQRDPATASKYVDLIAQSGVGWARVAATWPQVQPGQSGYDWSGLDAQINALRAKNINVLLNIRSAPCWALGTGGTC